MAKTEVIESKNVLRFLQLLCEGHHLKLQNYLQEQPTANPVNVVTEIIRFLKEVRRVVLEGWWVAADGIPFLGRPTVGGGGGVGG